VLALTEKDAAMKAKALSEELDDIELWNREDASELERPSQPKKYGITVASRDWTVETIVRQVEQENIDLDPAFQRRNAWRDHRRSRLVESFVLGFPVPQLVLAENPRRRGTFIVIDGKQRLLTIAGLYLTSYRNYWANPRFSGLSVLTDLNGIGLDNFLKESQYSKDRRQLANADIRTTVITGFQDEDVLYDIFYRINTGSVPLSSQELRQVLNRGEFAKYLLEITSEPNPLWNVLGIDAPDPRLRDCGVAPSTGRMAAILERLPGQHESVSRRSDGVPEQALGGGTTKYRGFDQAVVPCDDNRSQDLWERRWSEVQVRALRTLSQSRAVRSTGVLLLICQGPSGSNKGQVGNPASC
jgi:hypothetical protein